MPRSIRELAPCLLYSCPGRQSELADAKKRMFDKGLNSEDKEDMDMKNRLKTAVLLAMVAGVAMATGCIWVDDDDDWDDGHGYYYYDDYYYYDNYNYSSSSICFVERLLTFIPALTKS